MEKRPASSPRMVEKKKPRKSLLKKDCNSSPVIKNEKRKSRVSFAPKVKEVKVFDEYTSNSDCQNTVNLLADSRGEKHNPTNISAIATSSTKDTFNMSTVPVPILDNTLDILSDTPPTLILSDTPRLMSSTVAPKKRTSLLKSVHQRKLFRREVASTREDTPTPTKEPTTLRQGIISLFAKVEMENDADSEETLSLGSNHTIAFLRNDDASLSLGSSLVSTDSPVSNHTIASLKIDPEKTVLIEQTMDIGNMELHDEKALNFDKTIQLQETLVQSVNIQEDTTEAFDYLEKSLAQNDGLLTPELVRKIASDPRMSVQRLQEARSPRVRSPLIDFDGFSRDIGPTYPNPGPNTPDLGISKGRKLLMRARDSIGLAKFQLQEKVLRNLPGGSHGVSALTPVSKKLDMSGLEEITPVKLDDFGSPSSMEMSLLVPHKVTMAGDSTTLGESSFQSTRPISPTELPDVPDQTDEIFNMVNEIQKFFGRFKPSQTMMIQLPFDRPHAAIMDRTLLTAKVERDLFLVKNLSKNLNRINPRPVEYHIARDFAEFPIDLGQAEMWSKEKARNAIIQNCISAQVGYLPLLDKLNKARSESQHIVMEAPFLKEEVTGEETKSDSLEHELSVLKKISFVRSQARDDIEDLEKSINALLKEHESLQKQILEIPNVEWPNWGKLSEEACRRHNMVHLENINILSFLDGRLLLDLKTKEFRRNDHLGTETFHINHKALETIRKHECLNLTDLDNSFLSNLALRAQEMPWGPQVPDLINSHNEMFLQELDKVYKFITTLRNELRFHDEKLRVQILLSNTKMIELAFVFDFNTFTIRFDSICSLNDENLELRIRHAVNNVEVANRWYLPCCVAAVEKLDEVFDLNCD